MRKIRLVAILFAASMFFASCMQEDPMEELLNDTELEQTSDGTDGDGSPPPPPPSGG